MSSGAVARVGLEDFFGEIDKENLSPLWTVLTTLMPHTPTGSCDPHLWNFETVKAFLLRAGDLVTAREATRRVLVLENPALRGQRRTTTSLYAGLQLVKPGEVAPAHRHSQSALRFVLDGDGAHTSVNGERTLMHYGDFVITPADTWHDHGNEGADPMIWLDVLDLPMASFFDVCFLDEYPQESQPITRRDGDLIARYGMNMLPEAAQATGTFSPIFNYSYARARQALEDMRKQDEWDPCHGLKLRYANPLDGGYATPTIASFLQLIPKGFATAAYRSTDASVVVVVEGEGTSTIDGQTFHWKPKDIFVVPSWKWVSHSPEADTVLFSCSDRAAQEKLGFFKQDRGNN